MHPTERLAFTIRRLWAKRIAQLTEAANKTNCTILETTKRSIVIRDERMRTYGERIVIKWMADLTNYHTPAQ